MEISELINYMENDYNFNTSYSYEELKETADYLHELAVQGNTDAQYAYATLYNNVYYKPWDKLDKNKWYREAIHTYEAMNSSDPEILCVSLRHF